MASWRFKVSKYKNATPIVPKKEDCLTDLKVGNPQSCGSHVRASAAFVAHTVENRGGGSVGIVPLGSCKGRQAPNAPLIQAHTDFVTDFAFSPFHDGLLATCSADTMVHLWHVPPQGLISSLSAPEATLAPFDKRVELVVFNPAADALLSVCCGGAVTLWDVNTSKHVYGYSDHGDQILGLSWSLDGQLMSSVCKDKQLRIIDPRTSKLPLKADSHTQAKDSKVCWLSGHNKILTTGWDSSRAREVKIRDTRQLGTPYKTLAFDASTGILLPLYDPDTNMLFLAGKADTSIAYYEVTDSEPFLLEGRRHGGTLQTKGACLVPKRALDVMAAEVNKVLQLTSSAIIPISFQVPRKSYREFHSDLYPDTLSPEPACSVTQWLAGSQNTVKKTSLNPSQRPHPDWEVHRGPLSEFKTLTWGEAPTPSPPPPIPAPRSKVANGKVEEAPTPIPRPAQRSSFNNNKNNNNNNNKIGGTGGVEILKRNFMPEESEERSERTEESVSKLASIRKQFENSSSTPSEERRKEEEEEEEEENVKVQPAPTSSPLPIRRPTLSRSFRRVCKFRHLRGSPGHKTTHIDNLRDLNRTIPSESDGLAANRRWVAVPLGGGGGRLALLDHTAPGRVPEGVTPSVVNGTNVTDFAFDPFNVNSLAVACDDGRINLWTIPESGLKELTNTPTDTLTDLTSNDKVTVLRFHPLATGVLAAVTSGHVVKIWDTQLPRVTLSLTNHPDQIFSGAWSGCGRLFATLCRDGFVRIYEPRKSSTPVMDGGDGGGGGGGGGGRGGRILWGPKDELLITTGFNRVSERQISVYSIKDISKPVTTIGIDVSPAILTPYFDPDSGVLLTTGKGDCTIYAHEVGLDFPHLFPLTHHKATTVHQGLVMLPKTLCDVKSVEFCKMLRLTSSTLEPLTFSVPRVKTEFFQDDLFPLTRVTWEPVMTAAEWFGGTTRPPRTLSLQPPDMLPLSEIQNPPPSPPTPATTTTTTNHHSQHQQHHHHVRHQTPPFLKGMVPTEVRQTQHKLEESLSQQMEQVTTSLEQDRMEGVDSTEWED
ncbi:coronin-7-like isoform X2 [Eriocheir sinensis]|uniref:coronin-7-like isoform X2 n=1 Tax=Eriocheir sinensis TaxID=95602 RepID=UPI0021CA62CA|nr:coronin-7-like isoform X2 [Eriocheir sinensis]